MILKVLPGEEATSVLAQLGLGEGGLWSDPGRNEHLFFCNTARNLQGLLQSELQPPGFSIDELLGCALAMLEDAPDDTLWIVQPVEDGTQKWMVPPANSASEGQNQRLAALREHLLLQGVPRDASGPLLVGRPWDDTVGHLFAHMLSNRMMEPLLVPANKAFAVRLHHEKHLLVLPGSDESAELLRGIAGKHGMVISPYTYAHMSGRVRRPWKWTHCLEQARLWGLAD